MNIELYDHQLKAIEELDSGKILVGGVGSGKSRTALCYYILKEAHGSLRINGTGSYHKPRARINLYVITTARKRDTMDWEWEAAPLILSDFTVDSWNNIGKYKDISNAFFIFDEQRVVGSGAWVKSFLKIAQRNRWILLSATPGDTWTDYIPVFIANGFYRNRTEFMREHVIFSRFSKYPKVDRYVNTKRLMRQRQQITVSMIFDRPTLQHHEIVRCDYDRDLYKTVQRRRWDPFKEEPIQDISGVCYCLRKVVNSDVSRIDAVRSLLKLHSKIVIFYNFDYELRSLREMSEQEKDIHIREWNGHRHEPIPEGKQWIYLVQYTAGAEGWNCTETDTLIFFSQSYSYKVMIQAAGRIDRMNTPFRDLYYYHLRSTAPIDLAISRALAQKKNFNEKTFVKPQIEKKTFT